MCWQRKNFPFSFDRHRFSNQSERNSFIYKPYKRENGVLSSRRDRMRTRLNEVSLFMLLVAALLLCSSDFQGVKAQYATAITITINPDGSFTPSSAALIRTTEEGRDIYTLTAHLGRCVITVKKDYTTIDGAGYSISGGEGSVETGVVLQGRQGVIIKNLRVHDFQNGIKMKDCGLCQLYRNTIYRFRQSAIEISGASYWNNIQGNIFQYGSGTGIVLSGTSEGTTVVSNILDHNDVGIEIKDTSKNNIIANNAFTDNDRQYGDSNNQINHWNGDYDGSKGNYWSDYASRFPENDFLSGENQDQPGSDDVWDHPYYIYESSVYDRYPLVSPPISITCNVSPYSSINLYNYEVKIYGEITPVTDIVTVTLTIRTNASATPTEVPIDTNETGSYEYQLNANYPLTYTVEASWRGNENQIYATSPVLAFSTYWDETQQIPDPNAPEEPWWENIPGFPLESIIIGTLLALGLLYFTKKHSSTTLPTPK